MTVDYLTTAINAIWADIDAPEKGRTHSLARAAVRGCQAFRRLTKDPEFEDALWTLASLQRNAGGQTIRTMRSDLRNNPLLFLERYSALLEAERELMVLEGIVPPLADYLLSEVKESFTYRRDDVNRTLDFINPADIIDRAQQAQQYACELAYSLERRSEFKNRARTVTLAAGGILLMAFNGGNWVLGFGFGAPLSTLSIIAGNQLMNVSELFR